MAYNREQIISYFSSLQILTILSLWRIIVWKFSAHLYSYRNGVFLLARDETKANCFMYKVGRL